MGLYHALISADGSGDGTNLNATTKLLDWTGIFQGLLMGVFMDDNGAAATVDITLTEPAGLKRTILTATDMTSDTSYNPQQLIQTNAAASTGLYNPYLVESSNLKVTIAQGGTTIANAIIVTLLILEC